MKNFFLLLSILIILSSCEMKQDILTQQEVEQTILVMEHQALDRWSAGDPLGYLEFCADDVTYSDDIAAQTRIDGREEFQNYLTSLVGKITPHNYEIVDPKVQFYGDIAICTMRYHPSIKGEPGPPWRATDVYRLTNDKWELVHAHWSQIKNQ